MKLRPYPEYRDSGLPWLGEIPKHWEVRRNGRLFAQRNQTGFANLPILEVSLRTGVRVRDFENPARKQIMADRDKYKRAATGDIAYNMMRMWQGAVGVAPVEGLVSPAYVVARPFPETEARYFNYLFHTNVYMNEVDKYSHGIVKDRNRLYWDEFKQIPSACPPTDEQKTIADFLDTNAAMTRQLVRAKRRLIQLLNEQKQAIIHKAVTRGLDSNVRLKPSGIDWLGDVPEHWDVKRLKYLAHLRSGDNITSFEINKTGDYPVFGGNGLRGYTSTYTHDGEYILIGRQGALCGNINYARGQFWASEHAVVATLGRGHNLIWFGELLRAMNLNQYSQAAAQPGLSVERIHNLCVPVPCSREQTIIAAYIEAEAKEIDLGASNVRREIELLREYCTRLISDVVTGKLDVRGVELPALDETGVLDDFDIGEDFEAEEMDHSEEAEMVAQEGKA